jgi:hypothetical protein
VGSCGVPMRDLLVQLGLDYLERPEGEPRNRGCVVPQETSTHPPMTRGPDHSLQRYGRNLDGVHTSPPGPGVTLLRGPRVLVWLA